MKAYENELDLAYGEPPPYAHPVAVRIADTHKRATQFDKAIETYMALLKRFPKSAYVYNGLRKVFLKKDD